MFKNRDTIIVLIGADGKFLVLELKEKLQPLEELDFNTNYVESCSAKIHNETPYIFITACDNYIHVYKLDENKLIFLNSLPGHQNKIKAISQNPKTTEFVTCSLDNYIRLWKIEQNKNFSI